MCVIVSPSVKQSDNKCRRWYKVNVNEIIVTGQVYHIIKIVSDNLRSSQRSYVAK